mmetsp:Transcript_65605/g.148045  ORF Transcript_65605/g.148045 Transcript_65605/m.148045 type:complete len:244 (+) Transcript_65605:1328-2059(+)
MPWLMPRLCLQARVQGRRGFQLDLGQRLHRSPPLGVTQGTTQGAHVLGSREPALQVDFGPRELGRLASNLILPVHDLALLANGVVAVKEPAEIEGREEPTPGEDGRPSEKVANRAREAVECILCLDKFLGGGLLHAADPAGLAVEAGLERLAEPAGHARGPVPVPIRVALHDRLMEQLARPGHEEVQPDRLGARRLAEKGDPARIPPEGFDIALHPMEDDSLVHQPIIPVESIIIDRQKAKNA